jgi:hypothetical protein
MNNKIFCLETEWEQSVYDLKFESQAKPMLEFLKNSNGIDYSFRQVASKSDFDYYISHLKQASYKNFTIVYLCFHGLKGKIEFADSGKYGGERHIDLMDFAKVNQNIFEGKIVHFDSCNTLNMDEKKIDEFKKMTGASLVTGYKKSVDMTESFIFEAWLLNTLYKHNDYRAKRLQDLARKEMSYYVEKFKFVAY